MKQFFKKTLWYVLFLCAKTYEGRSVSVLVYHSVSDREEEIAITFDTFKKQIEKLKETGVRFVSVDDVYRYVCGEREVSGREVAVTFDDAYQDIIPAITFLSQQEIPVTIFSSSDPEQTTTWNSIEKMSRETLRKLSNNAFVSIEAHGKTHELLTKMPQEKWETEIEKEAGQRYYAYSGGHHQKEVRELVEKKGYKAGFGIGAGLIHRGDAMFSLRRNVVTKKTTLRDIEVMTSFAIGWYATIKHIWK